MAQRVASVLDRGERQPHLLLASFSLHYLPKDQRDAFFMYLATLLTRPMLLVIIKGVGNTQRPSPNVVRSVHLGLHYVVHKIEKHPRVVEARPYARGRGRLSHSNAFSHYFPFYTECTNTISLR